MESVKFPDPLPDPHISQGSGQLQQNNFLTISARDPRFVQMVLEGPSSLPTSPVSPACTMCCL